MAPKVLTELSDLNASRHFWIVEATATRKLTKLLGDAGVINSVPKTTRNRTQRRNIEDELAPLGATRFPARPKNERIAKAHTHTHTDGRTVYSCLYRVLMMAFSLRKLP